MPASRVAMGRLLAADLLFPEGLPDRLSMSGKILVLSLRQFDGRAYFCELRRPEIRNSTPGRALDLEIES